MVAAMKSTRRLAWTLFAATLASGPVAFALFATPPADKSAAAMAEAATRFLASLDAEQKKLANHPWEGEDRVSFVYVPRARSGAPLKKLNAEQRKLAHALLKTGLSQTGYLKASQIMELEKVLAEIEKNPVRRDPELYYFWVFGKPEASGTWGWKAEGHHMSLNFTVVRGTTIATTPSFAGANPAEVREGPLKGRRVLKAEEDLARELVTSFDEKARSQVVYDAKALNEILTTDKSQVEPLPPVGIEVAKMSARQKEILRRLLAEYAAWMPPALASERLARIEKAGFDKLRFGWAGGIQRGEAHYYRIAGPTVLVEYDNSQNNANHVHSVWRDFSGDFGRDLLREHLKAAHAQ
jgi:hypothetical protein